MSEFNSLSCQFNIQKEKKKTLNKLVVMPGIRGTLQTAVPSPAARGTTCSPFYQPQIVQISFEVGSKIEDSII